MQSMPQQDRLFTVKAFLSILFSLFCLLAATRTFAEIKSLGPDGGDVRRISYDPSNPNRILLGTSSGQMYVSEDQGHSWKHFAHFGEGLDYVLDSIVFDPNDARVIYVAAWSIERNYGELFKSTNSGKSWKSLAGIKGKSIRSFAIAPSQPRELVAGALDGIFRSQDGGESWSRITPENHPDLKDIQSLAVDPQNSGIIYAGTWHLAWKTLDGGKSWKQIKKGMIDDSDVFSIIVDPKNPQVVYASACSGIYKSDNAGELFHKVQGIPASSRRTRVLKQDPSHSEVVFAGTTEGLWRTQDAGKSWQRISANTLIINDVMVAPRNSNDITLATDRSGVLLSRNDGKSFEESNNGFTHRQVRTILSSGSTNGLLYAGMVNDKEYGGVFTSSDNGGHWRQMSTGLAGHDVLSLADANNGELLAGTDGGLFRLPSKSSAWQHVSLNRVVRMRVDGVAVSRNTWFVASDSGLFYSRNQGRTWEVHRSSRRSPFIAVQSNNGKVVAATYNTLSLSKDNGSHWSEIQAPPVSVIKAIALDESSRIWVASREGLFRKDGDAAWRHVPGEWSGTVHYIAAEPGGMMAVAGDSHEVYWSGDGRNWKPMQASGLGILRVVENKGRVFAATSFDGLVTLDGGDKRAIRAASLGDAGTN